MSSEESEEFLREYEESALEENTGEEIVSYVKGKRKSSFGFSGGNKRKLKSFTAMGFITMIIIVFVVLLSSGSLIPTAISERLVEETDMQYADAVESKKLVFQQALFSGSVPEDTATILKEKGVSVGYLNGEEFVETTKRDGELALKIDDEVVTASDFVSKVWTNVKLYDAFTEATYGRAAYYYDKSAEKVFQKIGTTRNNYTSDSDFSVVMDRLIGEGSSISVNDVELVEKTRLLDDGTEETYEEYELDGSSASSSGTAEGFISEVSEKNSGWSDTSATLNTADSLKVADTISKEKRSSLFFLGFMENISKMKAGNGNEAKLNQAMNYLYESKVSEVVDVKTGQVVKVTGTAMDSPSLYAILSGEKVNAESVENYSSDRVLRTAENQLGMEVSAVTGVNSTTRDTMSGTVASTGANTGQKGAGIIGAIGRFLSGFEKARTDIVNTLAPTVSASLLKNSYKTIKGVSAGEFLVEGAINVGKELAKASGATPGDSGAVLSYLKLQNDVLALDAKVDRMNRSPFDITSRNTFLGSIIYKLAVFNMKAGGSSGFIGSLFRGMRNLSSITVSAFKSLLPTAYADEGNGYLSTFGTCETLAMAGAVGSAQCTQIATFDTSTLNNPFTNSGFQSFVESNTTLDNGTRHVKDGSTLAKFIDYNDNRTLPVGVTDGAIISGSGGFFSDILTMIKNFLGANENEKRMATGAAFTNSSSNEDWDEYKYAQRYVSLARATEALRMFSNDSTAYNNIQFFEGGENPVIAYMNRNNNIAER